MRLSTVHDPTAQEAEASHWRYGSKERCGCPNTGQLSGAQQINGTTEQPDPSYEHCAYGLHRPGREPITCQAKTSKSKTVIELVLHCGVPLTKLVSVQYGFEAMRAESPEGDRQEKETCSPPQ